MSENPFKENSIPWYNYEIFESAFKPKTPRAPRECVSRCLRCGAEGSEYQVDTHDCKYEHGE